jgi:AbrB family looped-hinge helix DNA binding protein
MIIETRKIGPKGQVVIPKDIRDQLGIMPGERVAIELRDNKVVIQRKRDDTAAMMKQYAAQAGEVTIDSDKDYAAMMDER